LRRPATHEIETTMSIDQVVATVLSLADGSR
jgi:hypothetical protein